MMNNFMWFLYTFNIIDKLYKILILLGTISIIFSAATAMMCFLAYVEKDLYSDRDRLIWKKAFKKCIVTTVIIGVVWILT